MKSLVIYYSLTWFTKQVGGIIKNNLKSGLFEIKLVKDIEPKWMMKYFWGWKQVFMKEKPEIIDFNIDLSQYDTIIIWTPVWAFTYTPAMRSFFDKNLIKNKKILLYCTHEWWPRKTLDNMENLLKSNNVIIWKKDFNKKLFPDVNKLEENIKEWLDTIKF